MTELVRLEPTSEAHIATGDMYICEFSVRVGRKILSYNIALAIEIFSRVLVGIALITHTHTFLKSNRTSRVTVLVSVQNRETVKAEC